MTIPSTGKEITSVYQACAVIEGFDEYAGVPVDEELTIAAWQYLVNTGAAWSLQGFYGRNAAHMIERGILTAAKK